MDEAAARWLGRSEARSLLALGAGQLEPGGQLGLETDHVLVEVGDERPVLAALGGLAKPGPTVGVLVPGAGDGQGGVGLALVGDVVRLQLVGGVEVSDDLVRKALSAPEVLSASARASWLICRAAVCVLIAVCW